MIRVTAKHAVANARTYRSRIAARGETLTIYGTVDGKPVDQAIARPYQPTDAARLADARRVPTLTEALGRAKRGRPSFVARQGCRREITVAPCPDWRRARRERRVARQREAERTQIFNQVRSMIDAAFSVRTFGFQSSLQESARERQGMQMQVAEHEQAIRKVFERVTGLERRLGG